MLDKEYLKKALFHKTNCKQIIEACCITETHTGIKWKCVYDFIQGRSLPRLSTLKKLKSYLNIDLNKTIL